MRTISALESDGILIERAGRGDRDAFEELYRRFARPVFALARRQLRRQRPRRGRGAGDVHRGLRVRRAATGLSAGSGLRVALRGRAPRDHRPRAAAPRARRRGAGETATRVAREVAELSWLSWRVHSALERLPERERVVLELAYWSGLSQTEIASYLDVPLGTVKTRTRAGLTRLSVAVRRGAQ